jgi:CheY-like chemotaxis protein
MSKIMLVEDNVVTRNIARQALESGGFEVISAGDARAALESFPGESVSLVLQDLVLPDMDGIQLVGRLRAMPRGTDVPILAFSGILSKTEEARLSAAGFDDIVVKPIEPARLLQIVRTHLPSAGATKVARPARNRLLLVDDDPVQRKLGAYRLQRAGYDVAVAGDGEEALVRIRSLRPDLIVSDVLMPKLDGFGLCIAIRTDPAIAHIPILLITNSYLEAADRELARRSGATDLIPRTPELAEVIAAMASLGAASRAPQHPVIVPDAGLEREREQRVMRQLERQVALNANANQRCALLSAELSVLSAISEAVATQHDVEAALRAALAGCFDAGGIATGALYLRERGHVMHFGPVDAPMADELEGFFGHADLLREAMHAQSLFVVPSDRVPPAVADELLARANARSMVVAPLAHQGQPLGALVMISRSADLQSEDRLLFAQAVAHQISVALALAQSFAEKTASEGAARAQERVLRLVLESMGDGVIVANEDGEITHSNPAARAVFPAIGRGLLFQLAACVFRPDRVTPMDVDDFPLVRAIRGEAVNGQELFVRGETTARSTWLGATARPLRDESGTARGGVVVFRDVTAEKAAQTQLLVSDRMASLGMLAAGVAHEINNPLAAVLANLEMAIADLSDLARVHGSQIDLHELPEELRDARDAAERVRHIVRDLKIFSRSDEEARGAVDVERVLESSIRMVWNEVRHRARLVKAFTPVPRVFANEARLGQVFLNLIVNASQAILEGRAPENEIRVTTDRAPDGRVRIGVTDTGHGVTPEVMSRLFTPFFTTKPVGVGTGLGLAICHQTVTALGGEILVESVVGVGTTFWVLLPAMGEVRAATIAKPAMAAIPRRRGRVLVVDDEVAVSIALGRALGREHDVVGLTDPHEAIRRLRGGERFDVILCDLMMPTATGMDVHTILSELDPDQASQIIFITGGAFTPRAQAFLDTVPNTRLEKPFDLTSLRAMINARVATRDRP